MDLGGFCTYKFAMTVPRKRSTPRVLMILLAGILSSYLVAGQLVVDSFPRDDDRVTFRVPISAHFTSQLELDSDGDGNFTRVDSTSIEGTSSDIAMRVNDPAFANRVVLERDDDGDPGTPGGAPVFASASWDLRDYPPMLKIEPDAPLLRDSLYRMIVFEGATALNPTARRVSDGEPVEPYEITFRTLPAGTSGTVLKQTFIPPSLGYEEVYNIYLPAGYSESPGQLYPAIYLLHGGFGNEDTWRAAAESAINRLIDQGDIEPVVAVMPDGNSGYCFAPFIAEHRLWSNTADGQFLYGDYTAFDLPLEVQTNFNVAATRRERAVAGMSMGGFGAASVGLGHIEEFSLVAPLAGWQHSVRMVNPPGFPSCLSTHWDTIPDFGNGCPGGTALQDAMGPIGSTDLTHMKTINGHDLALTMTDDIFRGNIFIAHGDVDGTATVEWSDDISCALELSGTAHCYKRPVGVGHNGALWDVALEEDVLPRFNAIAYWADLPPDIDQDCVNTTIDTQQDVDRDTVADTVDNCRDTPNLDQADFDSDAQGNVCDLDDDGDGVPDTLDCDPLNAAGGTPPLAGPLTLSGGATTTIDWPDLPTADVYDLTRGLLSSLSSVNAGSCLTDNLPGSSFEDTQIPPLNDGYFYFVRGEDAGCGGAGLWGDASDGSPRQPAGCTP